MTTHLSARLAWHDRGWDGRVCDAPHLNAHCIVHDHIRDSRDDDKERSVAGRHLADLNGWLPPCSRDPAAYGDRGFAITHQDPLGFRKLPSVSENIPPYSTCPAPYRWMLEEYFQEICESEDLLIRGPDEPRNGGWVMEPDRQYELLKQFWGKLETGNSLIFYYCNHGNPIDENASRIIIGVGRIAEVAPQLYFGMKPGYSDQYPVWSRCITQDYPDQGVRIPYQEYLHKGHPTDDIICRVPRNALLPFSYGGEHVSDDVAVSILERVIQCIERVRSDGYISGDWDRRLDWLNDALAEAWSGRGAFPGSGSVLQYLGFSKGTAFQRSVLTPMTNRSKNPWEYVLSILDGKTEPPDDLYKGGLLKARERWGKLKSRQALLSKLARFELSHDQVHRISNPDERTASGINATENELVENPYILSESDLGTAKSDAVALETVDHGLRPEGDATLFPDDDEVSHDDHRRTRAVGFAVLQEAADSGDTVLTFDDFLSRIFNRFPERRACQPDREIVSADAEFYQKILWMDLDSDPKLVALKYLQSLEVRIASTVKRRANRVNSAADPPIDWLAALKSKRNFGSPKFERDHAALDEKQKALEILFSRRLSVLTGGAGTGKTSVIKVFLEELIRSEGRHPTLLLAPTGKARVRLSTTTKHNAMTIHQFLLKQGWFMPNIFALKQQSDRNPYPATTVIVDECSMIPADLFGTLLCALDSGPLTRLILVGDPNQLPPIGPGRPFADIIQWLQKEHLECIAPLKVCMRTDETKKGHDEDSTALALADGYRTSDVSPGDDEILSAVARGESAGDLEVVFWNDRDELLTKLRSRMTNNLKIRDKDYRSFNRSLGIDTKDWKRSEEWQILSPTRAQHFGTDDLNRLIQREFRGGLINWANQNRKPPPFGDKEIVYTDKVIQISNRSIKGWPRNTGLDYVANGEIGIVKSTKSRDTGDYLDTVFSTQPEVSYRYFKGQVDDNLDLAYALTVHKAQGSDFDVVFLIIPQEAATLSRELIYTGLTRFRRKLVLLIEKDIKPLLQLRSPEHSDTQLRNTHMFTLALRPDDVQKPYPETLIHRTQKGDVVRSKSEVVVANILYSLDISYEYEKPLYSRSDPKDFRLPDFTASFEGDIYYWEHLGMLSVPTYREAWEKKRKWYKDNKYDDRLIISMDGLDGSIDAPRIEKIARERILQE